MSVKWTDERRAKFKRTMAAKRAADPIKVTTIEEIGPRRKRPGVLGLVDKLRAEESRRRRRKSPHEEVEFARYMAAAWELYKGR